MLTFIRKIKRIHYPSQSQWLCLYRCDCGKEVKRLKTNVKNPEEAHCGCKHNYKTKWRYGKQLKRRWRGILVRTVNGKYHRTKELAEGPYKDVTVCDEWNNDFKAFYDWSMNNGFDPSLHIDRIDSSKGYSPDNCRWITQKENNRNGAKSVVNKHMVREILLLHGVYSNLDIAKVYGINPSVVTNISKGRLWKDVYQSYATAKNKKRAIPKLLLPIKTDFKAGSIDFDNHKQVRMILDGHLALEKGKSYVLVGFENAWSYFKSNIDKTYKGYERFRELIAYYYLDNDQFAKKFIARYGDKELKTLEKHLDYTATVYGFMFKNWVNNTLTAIGDKIDRR